MSKHASSFVLRPGPAFHYDPEAGTYRIETATLIGGATLGLTMPGAAGQPPLNYRLEIGYQPPAGSKPGGPGEPDAPVPVAAASEFASKAALFELSFVHPIEYQGWNLKSNAFGRLQTPPDAPVHGDWSKAGGDGVYRCLFRVLGAALPESPDRRFCFGARVRVDGNDFHGTRIDLYTDDEAKIEIRDYTGSGSTSTVIASESSDWQHGSWCWLDVSIVGSSVKARVYPERGEAPAWQVAGTTAATGAGGFGPGGLPGLGTSPVIDVKRLEFVPAS